MREPHRRGGPPLRGRNDTRGQRGQTEAETPQAHLLGGESEKMFHASGNRGNHSSWYTRMVLIQKDEKEKKAH